jgi:hypothetical protein
MAALRNSRNGENLEALKERTACRWHHVGPRSRSPNAAHLSQGFLRRRTAALSFPQDSLADRMRLVPAEHCLAGLPKKRRTFHLGLFTTVLSIRLSIMADRSQSADTQTAVSDCDEIF